MWLDASRSYDPPAAAGVGVDFARLTVVRPGDPVEALAAATALARSGGFNLVVFDCLGEGHQGLLSTWLGCMATLLHNARTAMLVMAAPRDGAGAYHGGQALAHYSSVILAARRTGWARDHAGRLTGMRTHVRVVKNKTGAPGGCVELVAPVGVLPAPGPVGGGDA